MILLRLERHDRARRFEPKELLGEPFHEREASLGGSDPVARQVVQHQPAQLADHVAEAEEIRLRLGAELLGTRERRALYDRAEQYRFRRLLKRVQGDRLVARPSSPERVGELPDSGGDRCELDSRSVRTVQPGYRGLREPAETSSPLGDVGPPVLSLAQMRLDRLEGPLGDPRRDVGGAVSGRG